VHHHDVISRKSNTLIGAGNGGIIPFRNLAQEYPRDGFRSEIELRRHTRNVVSRYVSTQHGWKMQDPESVLVLVGLELIIVHGAIGGPEIHGAFGDLLESRGNSRPATVPKPLWMRDLEKREEQANKEELLTSVSPVGGLTWRI